MAALMMMLALLGDLATGALNFDRGLIGQGQIWRLLSAHLVHLSMAHLLMNAAALILVGLLVGRSYHAGMWWMIYAILAIWISCGLLFLDPELMRYVGASGVIHGLVACGAVASIRSNRFEAYLLLLGLAAKIAFEQWAGPTATTESLIGGRVITNAHLYGAIGGCLLGAITFVSRRDTSRL